jgi:hypothetical protein
MQTLRHWLVVLIGGLSAAPAMGWSCITVVPRLDHLRGTSSIVRAKAHSNREFIVTQVYRGDRGLRNAPLTWPSSQPCSPDPVEGQQYLVAFGGEIDRLLYIPWPPPTEFIEFLNDRHLVTPRQLESALNAWSRGSVETRRFSKWLQTADSNDRVYRRRSSLLAQALANAEFVVAATLAAEHCDAALARNLRTLEAQSLAHIVSSIPRNDLPPPYSDLDTHRDRYNPVFWSLQDLEHEHQVGPNYDSIKRCWNRAVERGDAGFHQLLP